MARKQTLIHFHTSTGNVETVKSAITKGEIVVKHANDKPELYIKKDDGNIATFIDKAAIETIVTNINGEVDAVIGDVTALKAFSGHVATNFATKTDAQGYASTAKSEAIAAAKTETTNQVGALSGAVVTRFTAVEGDVTALEGFSGHVATNFATKTDAQGYASTAKSEAIAAAKTETTNQVGALSGAVVTRVAAVEGDVNKLFGEDGGKSVRQIAVEELTKQLIASGASENLNELKEIAAWIQQHPKDAAAMNSNIQTISSHTINLISSANSTSTKISAIEADVTALEGFSGHVATNFATKAVASGYATTAKSEAIAAAKTETTNQVKALSGAVVTRVAAVEADVTTIKNNVLYNIDISGITGVTSTKNGTTETINFANMVIDCGDF